MEYILTLDMAKHLAKTSEESTIFGSRTVYPKYILDAYFKRELQWKENEDKALLQLEESKPITKGD